MNNKKVLLVIEDEESLRNAVRDKLQLEGFKVLEAKNGAEGLAVALQEHPDLILLDIIMPVVDGITMLQDLRKDAWGRDAKVIMLTNVNSNDKLSEAMAQGSYDYLVKSDHKIEEIVEVVKKKLGLENEPSSGNTPQ